MALSKGGMPMKTLYLECGMGAAGDMLMAALYDLLPDKSAFLGQMNGLGLPGVTLQSEKTVKLGVTGVHMRVTVDGREEVSQDVHDHDHEHRHDHDHDHEHHHDHDHGHHHHHASLSHVQSLIRALPLPAPVVENALAVYGLIADAESQVHGVPVDQIHFHEVGALDAVADVVGVCLLIHLLSPDQIMASPVHTGAGFVRCAHGILPVPAPATALILSGVPTYGGQVQGELCTPTGAALLRHFVTRFGDRPPMAVSRIGYGMGQKDFERLNCVRAFLGDTGDAMEDIVKLECNLDDMTGEDIGFAMERLFAAGARDVYSQPIGMKKSRPGVMLTCVCLPADADALAAQMFKHTTTLGIRRLSCSRYVMTRREDTVSTPYGPVRIKRSSGMDALREKPEYEDLSRIARENDLSLAQVRALLSKENQ